MKESDVQDDYTRALNRAKQNIQRATSISDKMRKVELFTVEKDPNIDDLAKLIELAAPDNPVGEYITGKKDFIGEWFRKRWNSEVEGYEIKFSDVMRVKNNLISDAFLSTVEASKDLTPERIVSVTGAIFTNPERRIIQYLKDNKSDTEKFFKALGLSTDKQFIHRHDDVFNLYRDLDLDLVQALKITDQLYQGAGLSETGSLVAQNYLRNLPAEKLSPVFSTRGELTPSGTALNQFLQNLEHKDAISFLRIFLLPPEFLTFINGRVTSGRPTPIQTLIPQINLADLIAQKLSHHCESLKDVLGQKTVKQAIRDSEGEIPGFFELSKQKLMREINSSISDLFKLDSTVDTLSRNVEPYLNMKLLNFFAFCQFAGRMKPFSRIISDDTKKLLSQSFCPSEKSVYLSAHEKSQLKLAGVNADVPTFERLCNYFNDKVKLIKFDQREFTVQFAGSRFEDKDGDNEEVKKEKLEKRAKIISLTNAALLDPGDQKKASDFMLELMMPLPSAISVSDDELKNFVEPFNSTLTEEKKKRKIAMEKLQKMRSETSQKFDESKLETLTTFLSQNVNEVTTLLSQEHGIELLTSKFVAINDGCFANITQQVGMALYEALIKDKADTLVIGIFYTDLVQEVYKGDGLTHDGKNPFESNVVSRSHYICPNGMMAKIKAALTSITEHGSYPSSLAFELLNKRNSAAKYLAEPENSEGSEEEKKRYDTILTLATHDVMKQVMPDVLASPYLKKFREEVKTSEEKMTPSTSVKKSLLGKLSCCVSDETMRE